MATDSNSNVSSSLFNFSITNCSTSGSPPASSVHTWYILAGVITAICCLFGIPGNIVVMVKLSERLRGYSMSGRLFFHLALSDLLCLLFMPVCGVIFIIGPRLTRGTCQLLFYLYLFCNLFSLNTLVLIGIQRYYQCLHVFKWKRVTRPWKRFALTAVWVLAALLALPSGFSLKNEDQLTGRVSCRMHSISPPLKVFYITFAILCHHILLFYYVLLARGVKRILIYKEIKRKVVTFLIRVIAVHLILDFLPLIAHVVNETMNLTASDESHHVSQRLTFIQCFPFLSHCLNPLMYLFTFRNQTTKSSSERKIILPHD